ncbi:MAG TPA: alpha/beta fold hydrolase, partial [Spirochaetota bacterium]
FSFRLHALYKRAELCNIMKHLHRVTTIFSFMIVLFSFFEINANSSDKLAINSFEPLEINGTKLWVLIRSSNPDNPVFMYLHGGPGHSIIPWAHVATDTLTEKFTVVHYDQRGTGMSLDEKMNRDTLTMNQFMDDCLKVTLYLKKRFGKDKIYLLGHSWGSVLGMRMIHKYPEHYAGYIGVGQIVHFAKQTQTSRNWTSSRIRANGNDQEEIETAHNAYFFDGYQRLLGKYRGIIHNITWDEARAIRINSPYRKNDYTDDLFRRGLTFSHSGGNLFSSYTHVDFFKEIPSVKVPVFFFCGRYDYLTSSPDVERYYKSVEAPHKKLFWFEKSAHRIDIEEPELFQSRIFECLLN